MKTSMNQNYHVGRGDSNHFVVSQPCVSRQHLVMRQISPSVFLIRDLDSTYGTYVNGHRIHQKAIKPQDEVFLGGPKGQGAPWKPQNAFEDIDGGQAKRKASSRAKQKGSSPYQRSPEEVEKEFLALREVYETYRELCRKIRKRARRKGAWKRAAIGLIPFVGVSLSIALSGESSVEDKLVMAEEEFRQQYICPNCSETLGMSDWAVLKARNMCMACRVQWILKK